MTVVDSAPAGPRTSPEALHALLREILPPQGAWSDEEYLWLTDKCKRLIEFTDGHVQELPMPTFAHQAILALLYRLVYAHLAPRGGIVLFAALRLRIREGKFREPDLLLLRDRSDARCGNRYWLGADLVAEVVSPDDPDRDLVVKRADYAEAGIPEYWIVDPPQRDRHRARTRRARIRRARRIRTRRHDDLAAAGRIRRRRDGPVRRSAVRRLTLARGRSGTTRACRTSGSSAARIPRGHRHCRPASRRPAKNACTMARHSASSTPATTLMRWFRDG